MMERLGRMGRMALWVLSVTLMVLSLPAFFVGIFHIGSLLPFGLGALLVVGLYHRKAWAALTGLRRSLFRWACAGLGVFFAAFLITSGWMLSAVGRAPEPASTVIVLGAQVHGTRPSLTLQRRLEAAAAYLHAHPDSSCVVSGGQGKGEELSEGEVMSAYLIDRGIEAERIYMEDQSKNTFENLTYSAEIIRQNGLSEQVAVTTDAFHQLRGQLFARKCGLTPGAVVSEPPWYLQQCYWWREVFALAKAVVLGR